MIHSEFNGSESEPVHFLQIWIETNSTGTAPAYEQIAFQPEEKHNRLKVLAPSAPVEGAVQIQQDAEMAAAELTPNSRVTRALVPGRAAWLHVVRGEVELNGQVLRNGDSAAVQAEESLEIVAVEPKTQRSSCLISLSVVPLETRT